MKQTAVQWLENRYAYNKSLSFEDITIALQMEKEQKIEFAKNILEEAAENAELEFSYYGENVTGVDKKSITDTLNKYL